jgi:hypothetical protein
MDFSIEKKISNFIERQFPEFYLEEGENFVMFVKAYYEWLESEDAPINYSRRLLDLRDIDNTLTKFLEYFQRKYLYGIPFNTIIEKRFLLKHILDVYRSKGTIQCYRLLFKLLYNEDIEVYIPGNDVLRVSDGTWVQPKYIEVTDNGNLQTFVGKEIYGISSGASAVVESFDKQPISGVINNTLYISNLTPKGGQFIKGEKIILSSDRQYESDPNLYANIVTNAPTIMGSLNYIEILNGGDGFKDGDLLKIAKKDPNNRQIVSNGIDGELKVLTVGRSQGALSFYIQGSGTGYKQNANVFIYNRPEDLSGYNASFEIGKLSYLKTYTYNTDIIANYDSITLDATSYGFNNVAANVSATLDSCLTYNQDNFGTISNLTKINSGNNYIREPYIFVRTDLDSKPLAGSLQYNTSSNIITGSGTNFTKYFDSTELVVIANSTGFSNTLNVLYVNNANSRFSVGDSIYYEVPTSNTPIAPLTGNTWYFVSFVNSTSLALSLGISGTVYPNIAITDTRTTNPAEIHTVSGNTATAYGNKFFNNAIYLQANGVNSTTGKYGIIKYIVNSTSMALYSAPQNNCTFLDTNPSVHSIATPLFPANFASYEQPMYTVDNSIASRNVNIKGLPSNGNNVVKAAIAYNSGKNYIDGEFITGYLFDSLNEPTIINGGTGYANNELLQFSGGVPSSQAQGYIQTDGIGAIVNTVITFAGSGYRTIPKVSIISKNGNGAILKASITPANTYNTFSSVVGRVIKGGIGTAPGYWTTTRGFLNSDKYIHDGSYYQDYSYEIQTAVTLERYKDILYKTFHSAGTELFGKFSRTNIETSKLTIVYEQTAPTIV